MVQRLRHLALLEAEESLVLQLQESESRQSLERWPAGHVHLKQRVQTQGSSEPLEGLSKRESLLQCSVQTGPLLSAQQWHLVVHPVQRLVVQRHLSDQLPNATELNLVNTLLQNFCRIYTSEFE